MQVSEVHEHITHAVIGGKQAIDFGISNSAEFFNILSSTLYKDQILAVVREVLCNAWDAHIEAGCTDRPVQITLDSEKLIVKDFGKGIHHDDMGLIYGTYGNSTKKNDGMQTGGFGLGCKAPFAYTDHFEVTSSHEGIKTIYNLSKSSAQVMGKPGIIPIASFPTEETGLSVSITINSRDYQRFQQLVKRIAFNGDMNISLNGEVLGTLDFDTSKGNYLILKNKEFLDANTKIMIRYGNVIYPVDAVTELSGLYDEIAKHLSVLGNTTYYSNGFIIVFQAPPHSISVTPSRESLSMQEHTINTLKKLFMGFLSTLRTEFPVLCSKYSKEIVQKAVTEEKIDELLKRSNSLPKNDSFVATDTIADLDAMAKTYIHTHYPKGLNYRKEDITYRLNLMAQHKLLDKGLVQTFIKSLAKVNNEVPSRWQEYTDKSAWLQRRVIAPLLTSLEKAGIDNKKLYICDPEDVNAPERHTEMIPALVPATRACPAHILSTLPYLRNIIVLTTKRAELVNNIYRHDDFSGLGNYQGFLVYVVGRKAGEMEAARNFFTKTGMRLIDLTIKEADSAARYAAVRKPTKKGLVCLSSINLPEGFDTSYRHDDAAARILDPEFVIHIPNSKNVPDYSLEGWNNTDSKDIVRLFGDKGGIVTTEYSMSKWLDKGAKSFDSYLTEKVASYIYLNPRIAEYWTNHPYRMNDQIDFSAAELINLIHAIPTLMKEFDQINNLTDEDKVYLRLWKRLMDKGFTTKNKTTEDWLNSIPLSVSSKKLIAKLKDNPLLGMLDTAKVKQLINSNTNLPQATKALGILISVINS